MEATARFAGFNCNPFQRRFEFVVDADVLPAGGKRLAKEKGEPFLLASSREILTASLEGLRVIAAAATSNGDGDGEAGGDILCGDSQKESQNESLSIVSSSMAAGYRNFCRFVCVRIVYSVLAFDNSKRKKRETVVSVVVSVQGLSVPR
jgi:hypothetical protein